MRVINVVRTRRIREKAIKLGPRLGVPAGMSKPMTPDVKYSSCQVLVVVQNVSTGQRGNKGLNRLMKTTS